MILVKPDGRELEVNERSVEYALSLGWKPKTEFAESTLEPDPVAEPAKRRGRPPKVRDGDDSTTTR